MKTTYEHQQFLALNNIKTDILPEGIQAIIKTFQRVESRISDTCDQDTQQLILQVQRLDLEIHSHLEEVFFDQLMYNNEQEQSSKTEKKPEKRSPAQLIIDKATSGTLQKIVNAAWLAKNGIEIPRGAKVIRVGSVEFRRKSTFSRTFSVHSVKRNATK